MRDGNRDLGRPAAVAVLRATASATAGSGRERQRHRRHGHDRRHETDPARPAPDDSQDAMHDISPGPTAARSGRVVDRHWRPFRVTIDIGAVTHQTHTSVTFEAAVMSEFGRERTRGEIGSRRSIAELRAQRRGAPAVPAREQRPEHEHTQPEHHQERVAAARAWVRRLSGARHARFRECHRWRRSDDDRGGGRPKRHDDLA